MVSQPTTPLKDISNINTERHSTPSRKQLRKNLKHKQSASTDIAADPSPKRRKKWVGGVRITAEFSSSPKSEVEQKLKSAVQSEVPSIMADYRDNTFGNTGHIRREADMTEAFNRIDELAKEVECLKKNDRRQDAELAVLRPQITKNFAIIKRVFGRHRRDLIGGIFSTAVIKEGNEAAHIPNVKGTIYAMDTENLWWDYSDDFFEAFGVEGSEAKELQRHPAWVKLVDLRATIVFSTLRKARDTDTNLLLSIDTFTAELFSVGKPSRGAAIQKGGNMNDRISNLTKNVEEALAPPTKNDG
ncbi:hypothetical protein LTR85_007780 [Meristemomyces frigidus]|nr:hypothetical protein LTR85_007780 [Meristemomyces frigidus]